VMLSAGALALIYALLDRQLIAVSARMASWVRWRAAPRPGAIPDRFDTQAPPAPRLPLALAIAAGVLGFAIAVYSNLLG